MMYQLAVTSYFLVITLLVIIILSPTGITQLSNFSYNQELNNSLEDSLYLQVT